MRTERSSIAAGAVYHCLLRSDSITISLPLDIYLASIKADVRSIPHENHAEPGPATLVARPSWCWPI